MKNKNLRSQLSITLKDGRQLGFAEYGAPGGKPILFFHGLPGCRLDAKLFQDLALAQNYRLISIDRPGIGLSSKIIPWTASVFMKLTLMMFKNPKMLRYVLKQLPEVDRLAFHSLGSLEEISATMMETFRQGTQGAAEEMRLTVRPWGFSLADIKLNCPITIW